MLITVAQFFLSLSILVVLHELGHFSAAKYFKTKVEKFYLFFNPGFSLFKKQIGETEYGIGWLPLGGYVKIAGMIDESFDTEQMAQEPQPWEFRSKPAWQRLIIMVAGVFVNFVLGIILFSMILMIWGRNHIMNDSLKEGVAVSEIGAELGLKDGDKVLKVGDHNFKYFSSGAMTKELVINQATNIEVERNGKRISLTAKPETVAKLTKHENRNISVIAPRYPYILNEITEGSGAEKSGLVKGDKILSVNGVATPYTHLFMKEMSKFKPPVKLSFLKRTILSILGKLPEPPPPPATQVDIRVLRQGAEIEQVVQMNQGRIGVRPLAESNYVDVFNEEFSVGSALPAGWNQSIEFISDQLKAFGQMFTGKIKAKDSLGSFITIGSMFGPEWEWRRFWSMTASLSLLLAFINLLPIPALDGGYVMFLLFESITGKKIPDRIMEVATMLGFFLLMALMIYAFGLDISRYI